MPCTAETAKNYFSELFHIFFPKDNLPLNFNYNKTKETFLKGGYYKYISEKGITVLSLNSIYFMSENKCDLKNGMKQLKWLEN